MPDTYTKEQIDEVKNALREHALMVRETAVDDEDAVHFANDLLFLLAAFESIEQEGKESDKYCTMRCIQETFRAEKAEAELAEYKRKAVEYAEDSCQQCTALAALKARCAEMEKLGNAVIHADTRDYEIAGYDRYLRAVKKWDDFLGKKED